MRHPLTADPTHAHDEVFLLLVPIGRQPVELFLIEDLPEYHSGPARLQPTGTECLVHLGFHQVERSKVHLVRHGAAVQLDSFSKLSFRLWIPFLLGKHASKIVAKQSIIRLSFQALRKILSAPAASPTPSNARA